MCALPYSGLDGKLIPNIPIDVQLEVHSQYPVQPVKEQFRLISETKPLLFQVEVPKYKDSIRYEVSASITHQETKYKHRTGTSVSRSLLTDKNLLFRYAESNRIQPALMLEPLALNNRRDSHPFKAI